jgi:hypothetical protein
MVKLRFGYFLHTQNLGEFVCHLVLIRLSVYGKNTLYSQNDHIYSFLNNLVLILFQFYEIYLSVHIDRFDSNSVNPCLANNLETTSSFISWPIVFFTFLILSCLSFLDYANIQL